MKSLQELEKQLEKIQDEINLLKKKEKKSIKDFNPGNIFRYSLGDSGHEDVVICELGFAKETKYFLGGMFGNPCKVFSSLNGVTKKDILEYLNEHNYKLVGKVVMKYD